MEHLQDHERVEEMSDALVRKLGGFYDVSDDVRTLLRSLCTDVVQYAPGQSIIARDEPYSDVHLIETGWVLRSKTLESGARQIVNVAVAGDFVGYNA